MGQTILSPHQSHALEQAAREISITNRYYFTGGTALSACYLSHRISEDLDFFTEDQVNENDLDAFFETRKTLFGFNTIEKVTHYQMFIYTLIYPDESKLKIDFVQMPYPRVEKGTYYRDTKLEVDSVFDIAINKFRAMWDRRNARDFVDLYTILIQEGISLEQVIRRTYDKYAPFLYEDQLQILERLMASVEIVTDYPTMLVPFDREKMVSFFLSEAKKMEKYIFKS